MNTTTQGINTTHRAKPVKGITASKILIIDKDENVLNCLKNSLLQDGYRVITANDGVKALELARTGKPDLIILEIMLPGLSGKEVCRVLRQETTVPMLILTSEGEEIDKVVCLELGADDYMTKPFSIRELLARVRAMLRRSTMNRQETPAEKVPAAKIIRIGNLKIDIPARRVLRDGAAVRLTPTEFGLLSFLAENRGKAFSRQHLLESAGWQDGIAGTRTVNFHILSLRRKLEDDPSHPVHLVTVRGFGYKLEG